MPESKVASGLSIPGICCGCWQPDFNLAGQADVSLILYGGIAGGCRDRIFCPGNNLWLVSCCGRQERVQ